MRFPVAFTFTIMLASPVLADMIVATRTIRAQEILGPGDLLLKPDTGKGDVVLSDLIGMETRVALYPGRQVRAAHVGPPAIVERNQIVPLIYARVGLQITIEGRSLERAGIGDRVRAMNLTSRATITGRVTSTGQIMVSQ
ncbi:flagellar basal body P-ring formation chaperone FlgA [uncultured Roseovarius sp.]|uniref:flagellar basal body P-ring formation chaperone FlgA n=1 Tax=uncultured Roseovarius sp. TaxID=293344 RepID=UPI00263717AE|nr:flagellar basal body P-ring formation chaperone FlgA [uncultured Roseovarius sp.]